MKNFPVPSFFKIRLLALFFGFLVVCFLLGAAKHVFADWPGECVLIAESRNMAYQNVTTNNYNISHITGIHIDPTTAYPTGVEGHTHYGTVANPAIWTWLYTKVYYHENGVWVYKHGNSLKVTIEERDWAYDYQGAEEISIPYADWGNPVPLFPEGCTPPPNECPASGTPAGTMTSEGMFVKGPWCEDGCEIVAAVSNPGLEMSYKENGQWYTLTTVEFSGNTCTPGVGGAPPIDPIEPPADCATFLAQCEMACRGADQTQSWCDASGRNCSCDLAPPYPIVDPDDGGGPRPDQDEDGLPSDTDPDVDGDGSDNGTDPDVDGDGTDNGNDSDVDGDGTGNGGDDSDWNPDQGSPGGTGSDGDVDGDGESNCDDNDVDGDGLPNGSDPDADGDGVPNGSDLNPTGCDGACVDDPSTPENECGSNGTGECVDDPNTTQDECEEYGVIGTGSPGEPYSPGEFNIGERFNTFITRIRQTGVFALPNDFFNAPPSGGSPVFSFEFGSYGTRTVDLSDMSQPLLILRTIVLIAFGFVCLRVVILKR